MCPRVWQVELLRVFTAADDAQERRHLMHLMRGTEGKTAARHAARIRSLQHRSSLCRHLPSQEKLYAFLAEDGIVWVLSQLPSMLGVCVPRAPCRTLP